MCAILHTELNKTCPIKKMRIKEKRLPWVSRGVVEQLADKNRARARSRRSRRQEDKQTSNHLQNVAKNALRDAKSFFIQDNDNEDRFKFWDKMEFLMPTKAGKKPINLIDQVTNTPVPQDQAAELINTFFANIGPALANNFGEIRDVDFTSDPQTPSDMPEIQTTEKDVLDICKKIHTSKASAVPNLSAMILKDAFLALIPQLTYLINLSFSIKVFPAKWKHATIIPLPKSGDLSNPGNYRPIALLPLPSKIIERIAHNKISGYMETNNIFNDSQGGFRKNHSTTSTIAKFTDTILRDIDKDKTTVASFVDLTKAFDTVNHTILLLKLKDMGINLDAISWLTSYLENRTQVTMANNSLSTQATVKFGVPQGSILGPLLFLAYINDIDKLLTCNVSLYADDAVVYTAHKSAITAATMLQADLNRLLAWTKLNHLTINIKKTKVMFFGTNPALKKVDPDTKLLLGTEQLEIVQFFKYLGITLDGELKYDIHIKDMKQKIGYKIIQLARIRKYMNIVQSIHIYKSKVLPYFDYGDILYTGTSSTQTTKLQRLQNRALKICLKLPPRSSTAQIHITAKVNYLEDRRNTHLLKYAYKKCEIVDNRLELRRATRAQDAPLLNYVNAKKQIAKRSVEFKAERAWNALPPEKRSLDTYEKFSKDQKTVLSLKRLTYL